MGHVISGKKIGLTSPGIQQQMGVNEPDYGHLYAAMDCRDGTVNTSALILPKIEGEVAFILKADLAGGKVTREDVVKATDYVVASFEIVDSRIADWKIKLVDTISDNASSGRYVLGAY
jgi:2-keto-4-pentenoate hydratase